jgi:hypothetical protein
VLWLAEGALARLVVTTESANERVQFVLMWMCIYRAKSGKRVSVLLESALAEAVDARYAILKCRPQAGLEDMVVRYLDYQKDETKRWRMVLTQLLACRRRWEHPADSMSCGVHSPYTCPEDLTFDRDWSRHVNGLMSTFEMERRTDVVSRISARPVFERMAESSFVAPTYEAQGKRRRFH